MGTSAHESVPAEQAKTWLESYYQPITHRKRDAVGMCLPPFTIGIGEKEL